MSSIPERTSDGDYKSGFGRLGVISEALASVGYRVEGYGQGVFWERGGCIAQEGKEGMVGCCGSCNERGGP